MLGKLVPGGSPGPIGTLGVIWPSMLWPDETPPGGAGGAGGGGAAGLAGPAAGAVRRGGPHWTPSTRIGTSTDPRPAAALLDAQSAGPGELAKFHALMVALAGTRAGRRQRGGQRPANDAHRGPAVLAQRFAAALDDAAGAGAGPADQGGAAGLAGGRPGRGGRLGGGADLGGAGGDGQGAAGFGAITGRLWNGMKEPCAAHLLPDERSAPGPSAAAASARSSGTWPPVRPGCACT